MAVWTASQVRLAALEHLGIVGAGQAASSEDDSLAERNYVSLYARLRQKNLMPFDRNAVDEWAWDPLAKVLGATMLGAFGFQGSDRRDLEADAKVCMKQLQSGAAMKRAPVSPRGAFF